MSVEDVIPNGLRNVLGRDGFLVDVLRFDGNLSTLDERLGQDVDVVVLVAASLVAVPAGAVAPELEPRVAVTVLDRPKELIDAHRFDPLALGALVGRRTGRHFRPERRTPMHDCHRERGAEFVRAGQWLRPRYYPEHGADVDTAYVAEMRAVREAVGMVDVSTLGKIDVQGPDAPEFLNRVYANGWLKLAVGKARYGAMLRDDGLVFDDGTTSRLAEHRYFMTTTTAEAGPVMSWLEFLLDTAWPDLRVHVTSVSDQWAGVAVAGSSGGHVLAAALDGVDTSDDTLPPMGVRDATTDDGLPVRILRVSFSGERAYEVYTPAGYGAHLWERLMAAGQPHGI